MRTVKYTKTTYPTLLAASRNEIIAFTCALIKHFLSFRAFALSLSNSEAVLFLDGLILLKNVKSNIMFVTLSRRILIKLQNRYQIQLCTITCAYRKIFYNTQTSPEDSRRLGKQIQYFPNILFFEICNKHIQKRHVQKIQRCCKYHVV